MAKSKKGKFILNIGDEGGILTYMQGKAVVRRLFAPTANYSDTRMFIDLFQSDPKAPIYMLADMMDQSYVQHSLPPVSSLSINNLIKRKMERDFSGDDLRGALQIGREKEGRKDWKYLFVTLSNSAHLQSWIELVMEQPNRFVGIYLLPVEAEGLILRLDEAISGRKKRGKKGDELGTQWQLLVAHNKVGGFRQVVLKDGKLIFARLAQPIGDNQPEVIAGNIEQEISVTTEYLKRLGYAPDQGMDVYIIASEFIKQAVDTNNIQASSVYAMSPHEVALKLGLEQVTEPGDQFADVVIAAAFATAGKHLLKLQSKEQARLNMLYNSLLGVKAGGSVVTVAAIIASIYYASQVPAISEEIERYKSRTRVAEQELEELKEQEKSLPDDLEKMTDLVSLHQQLNDLGKHPVMALRQFSETRDAAASTVLLRKIEWEVEDSPLTEAGGANPSAFGGAPQRKERVELKLVVDMYGTEVGSVQFDTMVTAYLEELRKGFAGYEVELTSDRPGGQGKKTDFSLDSESRDPILAKPYFTLEFMVTGTGEVSQDPNNQAQGEAVW